MGIIRQSIENHRPVFAETLPGEGDRVAISYADLAELVQLAHEALHPQHAPQPTPEAGPWAAVFDDAEAGPEDTDEEQGVSTGYDSAEAFQERQIAMHFATLHVGGLVAASHGLDMPGLPSLTQTAEVILGFLKSGKA